MQLLSPTLGGNMADAGWVLDGWPAPVLLLGTNLAMTNTPAGAALPGVFVRATKRVMECGMPCVVPAQRSAIGSTASQRHRVIDAP